MNALIFGSTGQLGTALRLSAPPTATVAALDRTSCDICDRSRLQDSIARAQPQIIFNAVAYTAVDKAEKEPEVAQLVNATAVGWLAEAAQAVNARLIHVSTDFVFDGESSSPYRPEDPTNPLSVYGRTKREGELAAALNPDTLIVRTAWVHSPIGSNFVLTMLRLMSERSELRVVADQIGTPTAVTGLAAALWTLALRTTRGICHYTDSGVASWYDFAVAIQEEALQLGLLRRSVSVRPITTADYPTPARRPRFSVLDNRSSWDVLGSPAVHWRDGLRQTLKERKRLV
ncbi:MAG TPA: dTDP-4-dehydrorhamnose reductase [Steroidobacteraceae bacterium]